MKHFTDSSRYASSDLVDVDARDGRKLKALALRRLPDAPGQPFTVKQGDRLDVMAEQRLGEPTQFWAIADANTELEANVLVAEPGREILVPGAGDA